MCTAISVDAGDHYFGRNLDYEHTFGESICITPRNFSFTFINGKKADYHYALLGTALIKNNYPLYFDAINEKGLCMAGLNFPGFAHYFSKNRNKINVASYEIIPHFLSLCENVEEAEQLAEKINITDTCFAKDMPPTPLHWIIADKDRCIVLEQTAGELKTYDNPVGVLTNSPSFNMQLFNLNNYLSVTSKEPENRFSCKIDLSAYSRGMGAVGLPGDNSSMSRFVRAAFVKLNSVFGNTEEAKISQMFHILYSTYQQKGCVAVGDQYEITNYTAVYNADKGIYYFSTYDNPSVFAVDMKNKNLEEDNLICYEMYSKHKIDFLN